MAALSSCHLPIQIKSASALCPARKPSVQSNQWQRIISGRADRASPAGHLLAEHRATCRPIRQFFAEVDHAHANTVLGNRKAVTAFGVRANLCIDQHLAIVIGVRTSTEACLQRNVIARWKPGRRQLALVPVYGIVVAPRKVEPPSPLEVTRAGDCNDVYSLRIIDRQAACLRPQSGKLGFRGPQSDGRTVQCDAKRYDRDDEQQVDQRESRSSNHDRGRRSAFALLVPVSSDSVQVPLRPHKQRPMCDGRRGKAVVRE